MDLPNEIRLNRLTSARPLSTALRDKSQRIASRRGEMNFAQKFVFVLALRGYLLFVS